MTAFWQGKQVLVTGAGGFIGSHLVEALLGRGARVRAFVRYTSRRDIGLLRQLSPANLARIEIVFGDLARRVIRLVGRPVEVELDPERLRPEGSEVMRLLSDNSLARERLGWSQEVSLDEGLERTIAWIREHLEMYRVGMYEY